MLFHLALVVRLSTPFIQNYSRALDYSALDFNWLNNLIWCLGIDAMFDKQMICFVSGAHNLPV